VARRAPAKPTPAAEAPIVPPIAPPARSPVTVTPIFEAEPPLRANANAVPHIALLLPVLDASYGSSARAVQQGFMAAASVDGQTLPIQTYSNLDERRNVLDVYRQAVMNGAQMVIGPLTRKGVASLAAYDNITVPTLVLNGFDGQPANQLFGFGMSMDDEARSVAQLALQRDFHQLIVISSTTPLAQRLQLAFEELWSEAGRSIVREIQFNGDIATLRSLSNTPDTLIFIATDAEQARLIRPFLPNKMPVYATSQVFLGNSETLINHDLSGVRFVDMPWLLQPDQPAVAGYPRSDPPLSAEDERLYALGVDAYQLIRVMHQGNVDASLPLNGVTGSIALKQHSFVRTAVPGIFKQGRAMASDAVSAADAQLFPYQRKP
jgi:uncharacterized protein